MPGDFARLARLARFMAVFFRRDLMKKDFAPAFAHFKKIEYDVKFPATAISLLRHNGTEWEVIKPHPLLSH